MKSNLIKTLTRLALVAFATITLGATAQAGPGIIEHYMPVKSTKEAEALKTGDKVAISCGNCGAVSTFTVGADRSFLMGYTCSSCKKKFVARSDAHGGTKGDYFYESADKHTSQLLLKH
jgi:hypothetical protein